MRLDRIKCLKTGVCTNVGNDMSEIIYCDFYIFRKKGKENTIMRDYVLPDYTHIKRGYIRPPEETTGVAKDAEQVCLILQYGIIIPAFQVMLSLDSVQFIQHAQNSCFFR